MKKEKRGIFFSLDVLMALVILLLAVLIIYPIIKIGHQESFIQQDVLEILSSLKTGEMNNAYVQGLINDGTITDPNKSLLDQIGEFYITNMTLAINMANEIIFSLNTTENIGIWYGNNLLASKNTSSYETAKNIETERMIISGISNGTGVTGFSARAFLSSGVQTKYFYFGGYVGEGDISTLINYSGKLNSADLEITANTNFSICINDDGSGNNCSAHFTPSGSEFEPKKFPLGAYYSWFSEGINTIEFIPVNNEEYLRITGGFIKITYESDESYKKLKKYYFPGVEGLINIYDGFYIPSENLSSMEIYLHYRSNNSIFLKIGDKIVLNESSSVEKQKTISDSELRSILDYEDIVLKTVPLRLGLEEITGAIGGGGGVADIVFLIDSTGSMSGEINDVKETIEDFTYVLENNSIDYKLGLVEFQDYPVSPCGGTEDFPSKIYCFNSLIINTTEGWNSGNLTNLSVQNNAIMLSTDINGPVSEIVDQSQTSFDSSYYTYGNRIMGQIFSPGMNGNLTKVILGVRRYGSPSSIVLEIRDVEDNKPGSNILASSERDDIATGSYLDYEFSFSNPINLNVGTKYALVIKVKDNGGSYGNYYRLRREYDWPSAPYAHGDFCSSSNNGDSWSVYDYYDLYFMTHMTSYPFLENGIAIHQLDAGDTIDWDFFELSFDEPFGTSIDKEFRSSEDSIIWSDWYSNIQDVPSGRYIEQKLILMSDGQKTPLVYNTQVCIDAFTNDVISYRNTVNSIVLGNGDDWPESHLIAINDSIGLKYRANAKKYNIMLTDAPPHALDCKYDNYRCPGTGYSDCPCNEGPKYIRDMIDKLISKDIVFYYVSKDDGLCDNRVMADNMTNETGGEYYNYTESGGVEDIIMKIAGAIVNITYAEQTAVVTGNLTTKLYPDSYIEFDYEEQEVPYGLIITSEEEFDDDYSGHFSIPENSTIIETNAISYSGSRWTDNVNINDISVYNLSSYGSVYMELGDPYSINIPSSLIQENNEIKITTGLSPTNSTSGSEHNKIIYKIMKDITAYSEISAIAEGCIWNIQFEDDTNLTANIPKNYSGTDNCYYQSGRQELTNENDAIQTAVYNLLKLLDFDSNGKSDVKFIEQNFEIGFFGVVDIPYSWSTEVKVIRWD